MPESFNTPGDTGNQGDNASQGASFGASQSSDQDSNGGDEGASKSGNVDVNKLIKRVDDSQQFIETLKAEGQSARETIAELTEKLSKAPTMEQIVEQINQQSSSQDQNVNIDDVVNRAVQGVTTNLNTQAAEEKANANFETVATKLAQEFGSEVDSKVTALAAENDMTLQEVIELSKKNPKAVYKLLNLEVKNASSTSPSGGGTNTLGFDQNASGNQAPEKADIMTIRTERGLVDATAKRMKAAGLDFYNF